LLPAAAVTWVMPLPMRPPPRIVTFLNCGALVDEK